MKGSVTFFSVILFLFVLCSASFGQPWYYDFGTGIGSFTSGVSTIFLPQPSSGGGEDRVRIGTGGGSFNLENPGLPELGTGSELRGVAPTGGSVNKFSIYDYTASKTFTIRFTVRLGGGASGTWSLFIGDGATYSGDAGFTGNQTFTGIRWVFSASDAITTSYRNGSVWTTLPGVMSIQNVYYLVEIWGNNTLATITYKGGTHAVAPNRFDLWVNGVLVANELNKALLESDLNIDSFMFYGESSSESVANIYLDDIYYTNAISDQSLPVQLNSFTASAGNQHVDLRWITASEVDNQGFAILRSMDKEFGYEEIDSYVNNNALKGAGNSSTRMEYSYSDRMVMNGSTYWYKLVDVDVNGNRTEHGPISATPRANITEQTIDNRVPQAFYLKNYPNPFNPATKIKFDLSAHNQDAIPVRLYVYNTLGQRVNTLVETDLSAKAYEVEWNGLDEAGRQLPSGVYIYTLQTNQISESRKMTLMR